MDDFPTVYWQAWNSDATFLPGSELPAESRDRLWAVLTIVFYGDKLVLADIRERGWCIPSGKIGPGETIDRAAEREAYEETGALLATDRRVLIGCYRLTSRSGSPDGDAVRYCPVFVAEALGFEPIPAGSESRGVFLAAVEDVADLYYSWDELMASVFAYAQERHQAMVPSGMSITELTGG